MIVARVEAQWTVQQIAQKFGMRSSNAALMAVTQPSATRDRTSTGPNT